MNDPTPLTPEAVDDLLSADLDGDFDAAARELGLSASEARAQLNASPGVDARRNALTRARDAIGSRPLIESSVEDRLVAAAMAPDEMAAVRARRNRRGRQWRVLVATGSVAAAIAVIVGIASLSTTSTSNSKASMAPTPTTLHQNPQAEKSDDATSTPPGRRLDLGNVTNNSQLVLPAQQLLDLAANQDSATPTAEAPTSGMKSQNGSTGYDGAGVAKSVAASAPACTENRLRRANVPSGPDLIASGMVSGHPVVILLYDGGGSPYAYIIRVSDCALVRRQPLG